MKIQNSITSFLLPIILILFASTSAGAYCEGIKRISIDVSSNPGQALTDVNNALTNYTDYRSKSDRYEVCFEFQNIPLQILTDNDYPTFEPLKNPPEDLDVVISGLKIERSGNPASDVNPAFFVRYNLKVGSVILEGLEIKNVKDALKIGDDTKAVVINSNIYNDPVPDPRYGIGIHILGDRTIIQNSLVRDYGEGIRIEANDVLIGAENAEDFEALKNIITNNSSIGIHVVSGDRNRFGFNEIRANGDYPYEITDAVSITPGANEGVQPPQAIKFVKDGKESTLSCDIEDGKVIKRIARFDKTEGSISLYTVDKRQPEHFITSCNLDADGLCDLTDLPLCGVVQQEGCVPLLEGECGLDEEFNFKVTSIHTASSSSEFNEIGFDGTVIFSEGGIVQTTVPEATSGGDEGAIITSGAGGEGIGIEMATAGPGGCGGSGGSLIPNDIHKTVAPALGLWWLIFSLALIIGLRYTGARIHKHRRRK